MFILKVPRLPVCKSNRNQTTCLNIDQRCMFPLSLSEKDEMQRTGLCVPVKRGGGETHHWPLRDPSQQRWVGRPPLSETRVDELSRTTSYFVGARVCVCVFVLPQW